MPIAILHTFDSTRKFRWKFLYVHLYLSKLRSIHNDVVVCLSQRNNYICSSCPSNIHFVFCGRFFPGRTQLISLSSSSQKHRKNDLLNKLALFCFFSKRQLSNLWRNEFVSQCRDINSFLRVADLSSSVSPFCIVQIVVDEYLKDGAV